MQIIVRALIFCMHMNDSIERHLDVGHEGLEALHLPVRPPQHAELAAALLEHGEPDVHLPRRPGDGHVEVLAQLVEADVVQPRLPRRRS